MKFVKRNKNVQEIVVKRPKAVNRKRCERLSICLTPEEKKLIKSRADQAGMTMTDFVMASVEAKPIIVITGLPELLLEINRNGNNLNQLTRRVHQRGNISSAEIMSTCRACQNAYIELTRFVDYWNIRLKKEAKQNAGYKD